MMRNKQKKKGEILDSVFAVGIVFLIWYLLTLFVSPLVLPGIGAVAAKLKEIVVQPSFYRMIGRTTFRMAAGLAVGVGAGLVLGILMGSTGRFRRISMPIIGIMQTVPPVSWVVLALVWFGFNGRPVIFIVVIATIPVISISICEGFSRIDSKLRQMARLYHFSRKKELRHIILPSIIPYFKSAFRICLGTGWKIAVMGEVLTTNDGIGGMIKLARLNIEPESIIAWSVVIVLLFYISDFLMGRLLRERGGQNASG